MFPSYCKDSDTRRPPRWHAWKNTALDLHLTFFKQSTSLSIAITFSIGFNLICTVQRYDRNTETHPPPPPHKSDALEENEGYMSNDRSLWFLWLFYSMVKQTLCDNPPPPPHLFPSLSPLLTPWLLHRETANLPPELHKLPRPGARN